jgi:hypothetical protein
MIRLPAISDPTMPSCCSPRAHVHLAAIHPEAVLGYAGIEGQADDQERAVFTVTASLSEGKGRRRPELSYP